MLLALLAFGNWKLITQNYRANESIYHENIARITQSVASNQTEGEIILLKPVKEEYGFNKLVGMEWIEKAVKEYFGINEAIQLKEE